jgi:hypothetical protein
LLIVRRPCGRERPTFLNPKGGNLNVSSGATLTTTSAGTQNGVNVTNAGTANLNGFLGTTLTNSGTATLTGGGFDTVTNNNSGNLTFQGGAGASSSFTNKGSFTLASDTSNVSNFDNQGSVVLNGGTLSLYGGYAKQSTAGASFNFNGGILDVSNFAPFGSFQLLAGNMFGSASGSTIKGNLSNTGGTLYAGGTTGLLTITGSYNQGTGGNLVISVDVNQQTNSELNAELASTLAGTLTINWTDGTPAAGSTWNVALFQKGTGNTDFSSIVGNNGPAPTHVANTWTPYTVKV